MWSCRSDKERDSHLATCPISRVHLSFLRVRLNRLPFSVVTVPTATYFPKSRCSSKMMKALALSARASTLCLPLPAGPSTHLQTGITGKQHIANYTATTNLTWKVLDFIQFGGPKWMVGGTVFAMWLGAL